MSLRQYQPAQSYFQRAYDEAKARKTAQDKVSIYTLDLVDACAKNHDWKKVKTYAQEALVTRPNSPTLHVALGQAYVSENQPFPAMQELQKASQIDPYNSDYLEPMADAGLQIAAGDMLNSLSTPLSELCR